MIALCLLSVEPAIIFATTKTRVSRLRTKSDLADSDFEMQQFHSIAYVVSYVRHARSHRNKRHGCDTGLYYRFVHYGSVRVEDVRQAIESSQRRA